MSSPQTQQASNPEFDALFNGTLFSLLTWQQLDEFWQRLDPAGGWYLYAVGEPRPLEAADAEHVVAFIRAIDALLRREHHEDYCGIVYTDDLERPRLIKIYDPNHLGTSCGSSPSRILPGWVMSRMPPSDLTPVHVVPQSRRRWWQGFLDLIRGGSPR
ncbi:MAG: hypothetical protein NZM40_05405 [Sphingomonadaceae bacterium]|nr:hypothetical protein [Sphingomonadaceae bacterium]MDW8323025.1 hypothetical protein [Burkholderiales bacterium]